MRLLSATGTKDAHVEYVRLLKMYLAGEDIGADRSINRGSCEWLLRQYQTSSTFKALAPNTQIQRKNFYLRFCKVYGTVPYKEVTPRDLAKVRDTLGPGAGRNFLNSISGAYDWACSEEVQIADSNPAKGVKRPKQKTLGYKKWSMDDVLQFKNHYPKGHNARKCLALLLFTAREISGVRELGRGDVRDGKIRGRRQKTWANATTPMLNILKEELGDDYNQLIWLQANHSGHYSAKSLSQRFTAWANDSGLEGLSSHGLRKSVATILADLGLSERTIMAVLAHTDPRQAQTYVQDANNRALAMEGMQRFEAEIAHLWNNDKDTA
ncbi:tyrosine-type recombinase/integrase [Pacificibacter marinus]|uniref:tyrosine-type recombinase/integrase n=1 Tax=Pacificibacter marinus TaxID=658057 RepID=UPI00147BDBDA|nr:tyrosine-type recombinase/integrase [Pacificibacter marinus]